MALNTVSTAYDQHRYVKDAERPLGFRRKVRVSGGIQKSIDTAAVSHYRLLGENGNTAAAFYGVSVKKSVALIHPSEAAQFAGSIEHSFGKRGLAGIYMGGHSYNKPPHRVSPAAILWKFDFMTASLLADNIIYSIAHNQSAVNNYVFIDPVRINTVRTAKILTKQYY